MRTEVCSEDGKRCFSDVQDVWCHPMHCSTVARSEGHEKKVLLCCVCVIFERALVTGSYSRLVVLGRIERLTTTWVSLLSFPRMDSRPLLLLNLPVYTNAAVCLACRISVVVLAFGGGGNYLAPSANCR